MRDPALLFLLANLWFMVAGMRTKEPGVMVPCVMLAAVYAFGAFWNAP